MNLSINHIGHQAECTSPSLLGDHEWGIGTRGLLPRSAANGGFSTCTGRAPEATNRRTSPMSVARKSPVPAASFAEPSARREHPLSGSQMNGADMIVQVLADEGVETIFGYSGGAILPTYDAVFRYNEGRAGKDEIRLIVPATEQGAGFMAAGYARSSGRVGVSLVTSGPGATHSVTPARDCPADSVPIVLICGQVPRVAMGTDAFQEAPVFNI